MNKKNILDRIKWNATQNAKVKDKDATSVGVAFVNAFVKHWDPKT